MVCEGRLDDGKKAMIYNESVQSSERNLDDYIAGFVDGEGCFGLSMRRDVRNERKSKKMYLSWKAVFAIELRSDDKDILVMIKDRLGCGSISYYKEGKVVRYQVSNLDDLGNVVVPFFMEHPLIGKKAKDFELWKDAVKLLCARKGRGIQMKVVKGRRGFVPVPYAEGEMEHLERIYQAMRTFKAVSAMRSRWKEKEKGSRPS